jgi:hypothetical protein
MTDKAKRVEIGFEGGQVIALRIPQDGLDELRGALASGGWHRVETAEDVVDVDLGKVAFLRTAGHGQTVGFGSS